MKILIAVALFSQLAVAASPAEWNECVQSLQPIKTIRFGVNTIGRSPNNTLIFNNGFPNHQELSLFHRGAFWYADLGSSRAGTMRANLGSDSFCLNYKLKLAFTDKLELSPYSKKCKESSTVNFSQNSNHDSAADLAKKIVKELERGQFCFSNITSNHEFDCTASEKETAFAKIKNWNSALCKKLGNTSINRMIELNEVVMREYPRRRDAAPPAAPGQTTEVNQITN